jgi:PAS domain S-box-containing protein
MRKEIEQELQIRKHAVESSINSIILADLEGKITYVNKSSVTQWGFASASEMIGKGVESLFQKGFPESDPITVLRKDGGYVGELIAIRKYGNHFDVNVAASVVKDERDQPICYIISCVDITRSKRYEDQLKASLAEKEIMLREIHHRTKNNMQVISSLLKLQANQIADTSLQQVFQDCESRIQSMSLVHENLLRSDDFGHLDIQEYIRSLTSDLLASYIGEEQISFSIDVEEIPMGLDLAIPCGLILNELISNALKYAFAGKKSGIISIGLHRRSGNQIALTIHDNGTWVPELTGLQNTLGLKMVENLVRYQLEGTISIDRQDGTTVTIQFPEVPAP